MMPTLLYHGTDALSALMIQRVGFQDTHPFLRAPNSKAGFMYATVEPGWAAEYARARATLHGTREGVVLAVDVRGLTISVDDTVALDCLLGQAFTVKLPVGPERVRVHETLQVRA